MRTAFRAFRVSPFSDIQIREFYIQTPTQKFYFPSVEAFSNHRGGVFDFFRSLWHVVTMKRFSIRIANGIHFPVTCHSSISLSKCKHTPTSKWWHNWIQIKYNMTVWLTRNYSFDIWRTVLLPVTDIIPSSRPQLVWSRCQAQEVERCEKQVGRNK